MFAIPKVLSITCNHSFRENPEPVFTCPKMVLRRFADYLLTPNGKRVCFGLAFTAGAVVFNAGFMPNTFFLDNYRDVVRLYKDGLSVPLPEELKVEFDKAITLVGIGKEERKMFQPFTVFGFDTFHAGLSFSKFGSIIGIPINFTYKDIDSIDKTLIKVRHDSVPWGTEEATQLLESFILSENAQIYAIAREIKTADSAKSMLDIVYKTLGVLGCYSLSNLINTKLNLYIRPRGMRVALYVLVTAFMYGNYCFFKDFTQIYYEQYVDEFLKNKDPIFAEGGKEYYEKILQRNKALRKLLGREGENRFSSLGNENFFIRQRHVPLLHRKQFFEENLVN
ncbi:hypothetical protein AMK59_5928 [Oryctes borbonicus]|uniref:Transmembrane protein 177 n=1 Tax=Oryctes borbonicus TaxID=1629725 RepID=A0A0T6B3P8_9SCAR|nr:hypothetical protein AMK59_5928 [Oryctes borbonicus]